MQYWRGTQACQGSWSALAQDVHACVGQGRFKLKTLQNGRAWPYILHLS